MKINLALTLLILCGSQCLSGQEMKTEKMRIRISNLPVEALPEIIDNQPPVIEIIAPVAEEGMIYRSNVAEMDLIGQVTDESQINYVSVNSRMSELNENGVFSATLQLEQGENRIRLVAMDDKRNLQEQFITIEFIPPVVTLADAIIKESKFYALIIGIDNYKDRNLSDLDNPITDAKKLYNTLTTRYIFKDENITFLKDATRSDIIQSMDNFAKVITPKDNLLIFYAGHGWWDEESNNGYWLPSDAESHVKTNWFRNSALVDYLKEIHSKHTLLITDACFGGSIFKTRSAFPNPERAFEILYALPSRKAMTSGTLTEVPDRSSFTRYLVERLNENEELYLSSEQLFSSFRIAVINNSDALPQYGEIGNVGDQGGDFIFILRE